MWRRLDAADLLMIGFVVAVCAILLIGANFIPPPMFDPVGSAALPRAVAVALLLLVGIFLVTRLRGRPGESRSGLSDIAMGRGAVITLLLVVAYGALMQTRLIGFAPATALFLAAAIPALRGSWRELPLAVAVGLVMGFGSQWLFTEVFFIDLP